MLTFLRRLFRQESRGPITRSRAIHEIGKEIFALLDTISARYSLYDANGTAEADEKRRFSKLLQMIHDDENILELGSKGYKGPIETFPINEGVAYLMIGHRVLYIEFGGGLEDHERGGVTPFIERLEDLVRYDPRYNTEKLRRAILDYVNKDRFIESYRALHP